MASYRGFTVAFNSIGAGKSTKQYLVLANNDMLSPLLQPVNRNVIEVKCSCELVFNTRALFRKGALNTWVKYQLVTIVAPTLSKHAQAKRMIEKILPGNVVLEEYRDSALIRIQCNELVPDNKKLVFGLQRNGMTTYKYGELFDLLSPKAPYRNMQTGRPMYAPWHRSKRERRGVGLPPKAYPLERKLDIMGMLKMLLHGVDYRPSGSQPNLGGPRESEQQLKQ